MLTLSAIEGLPEVEPGFDLGEAIVSALAAGLGLGGFEAGDVLGLAHKAVSKSEGRTRRLGEIVATEEATALAGSLGKDPRLVQAILDESRRVVRAAHGVLITETHHGFVCANAGVDASNATGDDVVILLPRDPDASARRLRARLAELTGIAPGVVVTDSFGRAWRSGQLDVAVGAAGLNPLDDWRGRTDAHGRTLTATVLAVADELAAAADLARRKDSQQPAVQIRGAGRFVIAEDGPGAAALIRAADQDLFR